MRQSLLVQIIQKISPADRRALHQWLASPIHNRRSEVAALFRYLVQHLASSPEKVRKEPAFSACYPDQPYAEARMNHLMSWLLACIRDYLSWREGQADEATVRLQGCRALRKMGLHDAFEKEWGQARRALDAQGHRDEHYFYLAHLLEREKYEQASTQRRGATRPLTALAGNAATAYRLNRLRYECALEAWQSVAGEPAGEAPEAPAPPAVRLYESLLQALRDPADEAAFFAAKKLLETHWSLFRGNERRDLYLLALNYSIRKINSGQRRFMREAWDLYRGGLDSRALFENNQLSRFTYKNAVTAGILLGEFDWARAFIEEYRAYLPARERHNAYTYNLAVYYFRLPDYDQAMTLLRETDFDDPLTNLDARSMLLRIYYERGFHDALESLLDSFQTYLRRQKTIGYQRDNYLNLLRFVRRLLRLGSPKKSDLLALRQEILDTPALAERDWLMEQLA